jgi:Fur family peroxide stress response transcriptional regulator
MDAPTDLSARLAEFERACQRASVKVTPQRLEIFREVLLSHNHPSAEAIFDGVKSRLPNVSLDTVYRTLWLLTELGLITTLGPRHEAVRFDANLREHHHFVCVRCGTANDVDNLDLSALDLRKHIESAGSMISAHLEVRGICAKCAIEPEYCETSKMHQ